MRLRILQRSVLLPLLVEDRINYSRNELTLLTLQEEPDQSLTLIIRLLLGE